MSDIESVFEQIKSDEMSINDKLGVVAKELKGKVTIPEQLKSWIDKVLMTGGLEVTNQVEPKYGCFEGVQYGILAVENDEAIVDGLAIGTVNNETGEITLDHEELVCHMNPAGVSLVMDSKIEGLIGGVGQSEEVYSK